MVDFVPTIKTTAAKFRYNAMFLVVTFAPSLILGREILRSHDVWSTWIAQLLIISLFLAPGING